MDRPSSNNVWGAVLRQHGFRRAAIDGGSAADFCRAHPEGTYVLTMDRHVAAVVNGQIYDTRLEGEASVTVSVTQKI